MPAGRVRKERGSALQKALMVLDAITDQPQPVGMPDLTARVGLPRQTVHRILQQLEKNGLIIRDPGRDRFSVGPHLSRLALSTLLSRNEGAPIRAILRELVDDIQETCNVGVLDGLDYIYTERIECEWTLRIHLTVGTRVPAYCVAGGKAHLAHIPAPLRARLLRTARLTAYTENTMTDPAEIEAACADIRKKGYAINTDEFMPGVTGVGVPVFDSSGRCIAAVATQGPIVRITEESMLAHVPKLQVAAKRLAEVWDSDSGGRDAG